MQQAVKQRDVGPRLDREVQVGEIGGRGAARIDHDDLQRRVALLRRLDPAEQDRVRPGGVRSGDEDEVGMVDVLVARGRRVGAEGRLVTRDRARHAQPRVGVDVVGADEPLRQLVEDVVFLGQQLAGDIERDAIRPVRPDALGEAIRERIERRVPVGLPQGKAARRAHERMRRAISLRGGLRGEMQRAPLAAELAEVGRMQGIAPDTGDAPAIVLDDHTAAHAAVAASRSGLGHFRPLPG